MPPLGRVDGDRRRVSAQRTPDVRLRNYVLVTAGYWVFTLTDGALRMLVLLHFSDLGYSPVAIAFLFLAYEFMGILTNSGGRGRFAPWAEPDTRGRPVSADRGVGGADAGGPVVATVVVGDVRDGDAGPQWDREGPHQDEFEECGEDGGRLGRRGPVPTRCDPHGFEECAEGCGLLPRRGLCRRGWTTTERCGRWPVRWR